MSDLKLKGSIKIINDTQQVTDSFKKREFVITTEGDYPQDVKFEATQDRVSILDGLSIGDTVDVSFNIRGNEYKEKYYVNLQAWKLDTVDVGNEQASSEVIKPSAVTEPGTQDDLPF